MRSFLLAIFVSLSCPSIAQDPLQPVGFWREHLPYNSAIDVTAGSDRVFCATPYSLFSVSHKNNLVERYSRITGLSETGISTIRYDKSADKLFIAYTNSNIDILYRNEIRNIPDIKRSTAAGDKQVYNITPVDRYCYLSSGLGVIVLDTEKEEVKDTWMIGQGGNPVKVNGFAKGNGFFYAATSEGLKSIQVNSTNPANASNWTIESGQNGLPAGSCSNVMFVEGKVIVEKNDSLFSGNAGAWTFLYADGWPVVSTNATGGGIQLCERNASGISRVVLITASGMVSRVFANTGAVSFPRKAVVEGNDTWIADQFACLSRFGAGPDYEQFTLNSPQGLASGELTVVNNRFYATAGAVNDSWNYQYNGDGIFILADGKWTNTNRYRYSQLDSLLDIITIAIDPVDGTTWAGSYGGGLLHEMPGPVFEIYKQGVIGETVGDPGSYRVSGLAFDHDRNLWVSNFGSTSQLIVRQPGGAWRSFTVPYSLFENALGQIIFDDQNVKWIVAPLGNGLIAFDHGSNIDDPNDDRWRRMGIGQGNGGLPSNDVLSVAKDRNGFIWVGTSDGVGVIECPESVFAAQGCDAVWPVVPNGNFAGYLFKGQEVRDIAVDGANRKWIATRNGVFLVSATGEKVVYGFTEDNSPLLSNDVKQVAIDGKTGEVYFATLKGMCSFRSTATQAEEETGGILVFPNPVPAGYSGTIGIRGLPADVTVKITELDGRLVYQTTALGGQAVWDGRNYKGQRISSGAYLVIIVDKAGRQKNAGKIFFISK